MARDNSLRHPILYGCERVAVAPLLSLLLPSQFLRSDTRNAFQYEVHNTICFESLLTETMVRFVPSHRCVKPIKPTLRFLERSLHRLDTMTSSVHNNLIFRGFELLDSNLSHDTKMIFIYLFHMHSIPHMMHNTNFYFLHHYYYTRALAII